MKRNTTVTIYADGGCVPNPGQGGWAAVLHYRGVTKEIAGTSEGPSTNNRMELTAILEGLKGLEESSKVIVFSDSEVAVKVLNGEYRARANRDLVDEIQEVCAKAGHRVKFLWIPGHQRGLPAHQRADRLATKAIEDHERRRIGSKRLPWSND